MTWAQILAARVGRSEGETAGASTRVRSGCRMTWVRWTVTVFHGMGGVTKRAG